MVDGSGIRNYDVIMKTQIIQIGNSQGVRIPKVLLEETGISGDVELELVEDGILIRNIQKPRAHWDEGFRAMSENEDDELMDRELPTNFDKRDWQW